MRRGYLVSARDFCTHVLVCTHRLKIPSHLHTLSEPQRVRAGCALILVCTRRKKKLMRISRIIRVFDGFEPVA